MKTPGRFCFTAVLLLALMALLAGGAARRESVTFDEIAHIGAGVSYLQKLDMRMNEEHPPLAKVLAALPLVLRGAHADYSHLSWTFSGKIFHQFLGEWVFGHWFLMQWNDPYSTLLWARAPMLLMTLLLGLILYTCGSRLGGDWGGLLCLSAFVTMPAFIAFGPLVITDIAVTLFWVLTVWQLPSMWRSETRGTVVKFGLALAGALLSKFSSGLLFFVFVAFVLSLRCKPLPEQPLEKTELRRWRRRAWRNLAKGTLWAALFVYLVYLVLSWSQPTDSFQIIPHFPASPVLRRLLMPLWIYLRGLVGICTQCSEPSHLHPRPSLSARSLVLFPRALPFEIAVGVPFAPPSCLLRHGLDCEAAFTRAFGDTHRAWTCTGGAVWVSLAVFVAACMLNRLDLSIRHFSVALALIVLLLAPLPRALELLRDSSPQAARIGNWLTIVLVLTSIVTAIRVYPNYFPYSEHSQHGTAGLHLGQRLEPRLEPRSSRSGEFRAPARSEADPARGVWILRVCGLRSPGVALGLPATCIARRRPMGGSLR